MTRTFSVASWNVEHFQDKEGRNDKRIAFLREQQPDVLAIYEVEGKEVWRQLMEKLPGYSFFITEGRNTQEILVGIGPDVTGFLTQRTEFNEGNVFMRPGALLTVRADGEDYALLFLHVASWPDAGGFGLRADMIERAFKFRKALDKAARKPANYLFLGDLNSMGLDYEYDKVGRNVQHARVSAEQEISRLSYLAGKHSMRLATKNADATWGDPSKPSMRSNLDHVVVADHLRFVQFDGADIDVRGWPKLPASDQADWIRNYSDHGLLYFEVEKAV